MWPKFCCDWSRCMRFPLFVVLIRQKTVTPTFLVLNKFITNQRYRHVTPLLCLGVELDNNLFKISTNLYPIVKRAIDSIATWQPSSTSVGHAWLILWPFILSTNGNLMTTIFPIYKKRELTAYPVRYRFKLVPVCIFCDWQPQGQRFDMRGL